MKNNQYLHLPLEQLTFVRVISGIDGFSAPEPGLLKMVCPTPARNTTHGTLNAVVSDHYAGSFRDSRFAVVSNLLDMAKQNELLSLAPADTYFWNQSSSVLAPDAVLFAPDNYPIPQQISERINIKTYPASASPDQNFKHLSQAIEQHFIEQNLPFHQVDGRAWVNLPYQRPGIDHGAGLDNVANAIGYAIDSGLHDGTPHSRLEKVARDLQRLQVQCDQIHTKEQYEASYTLRAQQQQLPVMQELDQLGREYQFAMSKLLRQHKPFYSQLIEPVLEQVGQDMNHKLDVWYPVENLSTPAASMPPPPPPPPSPPPIPDAAKLAVPALSAYASAFMAGKPVDGVSRNTLHERSSTEVAVVDTISSLTTLQYSLMPSGLEHNMTAQDLLHTFKNDPFYEQLLQDPILSRQHSNLQMEQRQLNATLHSYLDAVQKDLAQIPQEPMQDPQDVSRVSAFQAHLYDSMRSIEKTCGVPPAQYKQFKELDERLQQSIRPATLEARADKSIEPASP